MPRPEPPRRPWAWLPLLILPAVTWTLWAGRIPAWAEMWLLAWTIFAGCKCLVWWHVPLADGSIGRCVGFMIAWTGMDAAAFAGSRHVATPAPREWRQGSVALLLGLVGLACAIHGTTLPTQLRGWLGMSSVVLVLHFGLFHLASCIWRRAGIDAPPLMDRPWASTTIAEWWGRRWNTAFRDLTHRFLYRPLRQRLGATGALIVGFAVSGIVHDLVISLPARGGYGLPTIYFLIQAFGILAERSQRGRRWGLGRRWSTLLVILLPAPLLFHPPFLERVIVPFVAALR